MGVVVDFAEGIYAMLDELQETYDGRILSPQGKIIRIMPRVFKKEENGGELFHGRVYVTTLMHDEIYQALLEVPAVYSDGDRDKKMQEISEELQQLTDEIEEEISHRGFIIRRGRYIFKGEDPHLAE
jgi:hypothetical protein